MPSATAKQVRCNQTLASAGHLLGTSCLHARLHTNAPGDSATRSVHREVLSLILRPNTPQRQCKYKCIREGMHASRTPLKRSLAPTRGALHQPTTIDHYAEPADPPQAAPPPARNCQILAQQIDQKVLPRRFQFCAALGQPSIPGPTKPEPDFATKNCIVLVFKNWTLSAENALIFELRICALIFEF